MPIHAVIFDVGGVLLRTGARTARRKLEARLGLLDGELNRIIWGSNVAARAMIGQATEDDVWRDVANTLQLDEIGLREFKTDFWSDEQLDLALVQFLRALRPQHRIALLSNAWGSARQALTDKYSLDTAVDLMVMSAEEGLQKPDPRIYQIALQRLNVLPAEAIFVDDVLENVQAAQSIGMVGIQFKETAQTIAEVKKYLE